MDDLNDLGTNLDDAILGRINDLERQRDELTRRLASGPAWHDRPTGPGTWLFMGMFASRADVAIALTNEDIATRLWSRRCFGPIPPDPNIRDTDSA